MYLCFASVNKIFLNTTHSKIQLNPFYIFPLEEQKFVIIFIKIEIQLIDDTYSNHKINL